MDDSAPLLRVQNLTVSFREARRRLAPAAGSLASDDADPSPGSSQPTLDGVSFDVQAGTVLAILGESGSGKSLIGRCIMGLLPPGARVQSGEILFDNRNLLELSEDELSRLGGSKLAMIFQEASTALSPVHTVGWHLTTASSAAGRARGERRRTRAQRLAAARELLARVDLPDPEHALGAYPHQLSAGMRQRVCIAMALACEPRLVIADEPTTGLDAPIQTQILELFTRLVARGERAAIVVTHDLGVVLEVATHAAILYAGQIVEIGPVAAILRAPEHPYTRALLDSVPELPAATPRQPDRGPDWHPPRLATLAPSGQRSAPPTGCRFAPRCPVHQSSPTDFPRCTEQPPELDPKQARHRARCFYPHLRPEEAR